MAGEDPWYGGLLGNQFDGLDPNQKQQAFSQGLLALGSGLLANQYIDPRNPGSGGIAKGLAEGAQGMMQAPQAVRQQAYQDAVMKQKLQEMQIQQQRQKAMQDYVSSLPADHPDRQLWQLAPDEAIKNMSKRSDRQDEYGTKLKYEPQIAGQTEAAKTAPLVEREGQMGQVKNANEAALQRLLSPILINRAGGEAAARERALMPFIKDKARLSAEGSGLGGYAADFAPAPSWLQTGTKQITNVEAKGNANNKASDVQLTALNYGRRMQDAHDILSRYEVPDPNNPDAVANPSSVWENAKASVPFIGNSLASDSKQSMDQAKRNFVNAVLRKESGAAIAQSEFDSANKQYFPQIGDSPATVAQKRANRERAIQGLQTEASGRLPSDTGSNQNSGWSASIVRK